LKLVKEIDRSGISPKPDVLGVIARSPDHSCRGERQLGFSQYLEPIGSNVGKKALTQVS
jgi:hypothetical protein